MRLTGTGSTQARTGSLAIGTDGIDSPAMDSTAVAIGGVIVIIATSTTLSFSAALVSRSSHRGTTGITQAPIILTIRPAHIIMTRTATLTALRHIRTMETAHILMARVIPIQAMAGPETTIIPVDTVATEQRITTRWLLEFRNN